MKWLPSILTVLTALATAFSGTLQGYVSHHPAVAIVLAGVWAVVNHLFPSPAAPPK
jgi:hypothetical protein